MIVQFTSKQWERYHNVTKYKISEFFLIDK